MAVHKTRSNKINGLHSQRAHSQNCGERRSVKERFTHGRLTIPPHLGGCGERLIVDQVARPQAKSAQASVELIGRYKQFCQELGNDFVDGILSTDSPACNNSVEKRALFDVDEKNVEDILHGFLKIARLVSPKIVKSFIYVIRAAGDGGIKLLIDCLNTSGPEKFRDDHDVLKMNNNCSKELRMCLKM